MIGAQKQASCNYADYSTSLDPRSTFSKPSLGLDKSASFFSTFEYIRAWLSILEPENGKLDAEVEIVHWHVMSFFDADLD
jgi:hypothetical protein